MRVKLSKTKPPLPGQQLALMLETLEKPLPVYVEVSWVRRTGFFKHEVGLKFIYVTDELRASLGSLARSVAHNEVIRPSIASDRKKA